MPNLVGIGNSQVPTNAMLGGLAYQDSVGEINIDKIKARTSDTAVDVFVYDTRKDSDGGAWRHRTQNTSWYNEGASATRGARKEFPSVAVVVAADGIYTIYDGDDPNLPMWMVFEHDASSGARIARQGTSAITMLNGLMCATRSGSQRAAGFASFIDDTGYQINNNGKYLAIGGWDGLVNRNVTGSFTGTDSSYGLAGNGTYYDVAMTVLPNAPIDDATGIQIPTIAIAHNSGISIITDSPTGVVYDLTANAEANDVAEIAFLADNRYSFATTANNSRWWVDDIQTADENHNYFYQRTTYDYSQGSQGSINPLGRNNGTGRGEFGEAIFRQASGMSRVRYVDTLINYTTTNYNTGWFVGGNIEGVFLSDTDTTNLNGSNLVTNGNFTSTTNNWTALNSASLSISSNELLISYTSSTSAGAYQDISVEAGKTYIWTFTGRSSNSGQLIKPQLVSQSGSIFVTGSTKHQGGTLNANDGTSIQIRSSSNHNVNQTYSTQFEVSSSGTVRVELYANYNANAYFDDVYVNIAVRDRSNRDRGIAAHGTVNVNPVATGAELVAYGPFSGSNFLRQPPNSNMNIGTGDAYEMIWFKTTNSSSTMMLISYEGGAHGTSDYGKPFNIRYESGNVRGWASHNNFSTFDDVIHGRSTADGVWHCAAWVKRGQVFELYVDGEFIGSDTGAVGSNALSDSNSELVLGARKRGKYLYQSHDEPFDGYLALARIGKTAPSAEAIKKTYNDEKYLFRDNAKCTLYGTSNSVTALAYDDTKNILHAGTSSGRSDFRGLNRINNTTTAVTTAISASDGLVAEQ